MAKAKEKIVRMGGPAFGRPTIMLNMVSLALMDFIPRQPVTTDYRCQTTNRDPRRSTIDTKESGRKGEKSSKALLALFGILGLILEGPEGLLHDASVFFSTRHPGLIRPFQGLTLDWSRDQELQGKDYNRQANYTRLHKRM